METGSSPEFRQLVREARLVLFARESQSSSKASQGSENSSSHNGNGSNSGEDEEKSKSRQTYQEALRLLQDPILPVRAHGLILLRELLARSNDQPSESKFLDGSDSSNSARPTLIEEALIPSIQSIFIQAIQDDESYLYLNAVQGLAELGLRKQNGTDRKMLESILDIYVGRDKSGGWGRESSQLSRKDVKVNQNEADLRLRVGEALMVVIQKCGDRLSSNGEYLSLSPFLQTHLSTSEVSADF